MGNETKISWTDATYNPWMGCTKVSPGCDNCYAENLVTGRMKLDVWGPGKPRKRTKTMPQVLALDRKAHMEDRVVRVFCASLADVFDGEVPPEWRRDLWNLIGSTSNLVFQLLTKRPGNVLGMLPPDLARSGKVWVGASMENEEWFTNRLPAMARLRMAYPNLILYASYEPALGPVDFRPAISGKLRLGAEPGALTVRPRILDWVIVGGESDDRGRARPFDPEWARALLRDAEGTGAAIFVKQMGTVWAKANATRENHAGDPAEWPPDLRVRNLPGAKGTFPAIETPVSDP